jgi:hypothetical protein
MRIADDLTKVGFSIILVKSSNFPGWAQDLTNSRLNLQLGSYYAQTSHRSSGIRCSNPCPCT